MTSTQTQHDLRLEKRMLDLAARAALRGMGHVEPNPLVGCVIAQRGTVLGIGHHRRFGDLHAEREALAACVRVGHDPAGATAYVTLEPCVHHGKQPPCTEALLDAGIARVVIARADPGDISRGGAGVLTAAGVEVAWSSASAMALAVADPWLKRVRTGLPWVIAKWAQTLDGRIATRSGESKWISSGQSRKRVHRLRGRCDAVVTGVGTVFADDPMLTPRDVRRVRRVPVRVVVDRDLDIPLDCALVKTASEVPTVVACDKVYTRATITADRREALESAGVTIAGVPQGPGGVDLSLLMRFLVEQYDASNVMVEAGPGLLGAFIEQDLVDEAYIYTAPLLLGDELARSVISGRVAASLASGRAYELARLKRVGNDIEAIYRRPDPSRLGD